MENTKEDKEVHIKEHISKVVRETLGVPKEHTTYPRRGKTSSKTLIVQPHNYRRYFNFNKATYNPTQPYSIKNHNSEHHFDNIYGCKIIIRKVKAEVINYWHHKQWRIIEDKGNRIDEIDKEMEEVCIKALSKFIELNGGNSDLQPIKIRDTEWGIHGDDYIDKVPREMIIHDTHFKKVYGDKLEFTNKESLKNYINNRAMEDYTPEIVKAINGLGDKIYTQQHQWFQKYEKHLESHTNFVIGASDTMAATLSILKKLDRRLSQRRLKEWL